MNVLLVGSGAREHALAWKLSRSPRLTRLVAAPGNPGIAGLCEIRSVAAVDVDGLVSLAEEMGADLVVIGPEAALEAGVADRLADAGIPCFGPTMAAARLETSKVFLKDFAARRGLPTARHVALSAIEDIDRALDQFSPPYVVKADGLAAGKGVVIAKDRAEAVSAAASMLNGRFGAAGAQVVIEEHLRGDEASLFALCDGETVVFFGGAQDHKRAFDGDRGPNTGGMGAYSPAPILTDAVISRAMREIIAPAAAGLCAEGAPYRGVLFAGLMIEEGAPRLIEFNARFGDPECQVLMQRLASDLLDYLFATATGALAEMGPPKWSQEAAIGVVLAAEGYPEAPRSGAEIFGIEDAASENALVLQAGTSRGPDGSLTVSGGRVLTVCARGVDLAAARMRAYAAVDRIHFDGGFHRRDIGWRAL